MTEYAAETKGPKARGWVCGVPGEECRGAQTSDHNGDPMRVHSSSTDARRCQRRYIKASEESDGPIRMVGKPQRLMAGKGGRYMGPGVR